MNRLSDLSLLVTAAHATGERYRGAGYDFGCIRDHAGHVLKADSRQVRNTSIGAASRGKMLGTARQCLWFLFLTQVRGVSGNEGLAPGPAQPLWLFAGTTRLFTVGTLAGMLGDVLEFRIGGGLG